MFQSLEVGLKPVLKRVLGGCRHPFLMQAMVHAVAYLRYGRYGTCPGRHLKGAPLSSFY